MARVARADAERELRDAADDAARQLVLLCNQFDLGQIYVYRGIATTLRLFCHDSGSSQSLCHQIKGLKHPYYAMTSKSSLPGNMLAECHLVRFRICVDGAIDALPILEQKPFCRSDMRSFRDWWTGAVVRDSRRRSISREDLVKYVANQDGGAHFDPEIDPVFSELKNSISIFKPDQSDWRLHPIPSCVRQIAHEFIRSNAKHVCLAAAVAAYRPRKLTPSSLGSSELVDTLKHCEFGSPQLTVVNPAGRG